MAVLYPKKIFYFLQLKIKITWQTLRLESDVVSYGCRIVKMLSKLCNSGLQKISLLGKSSDLVN